MNTTTTTRPSEQFDRIAAAFAADVALLGEWADAHPEFRVSLTSMDKALIYTQGAEEFAAAAKALKEGAPVGSVRKEDQGKWIVVARQFGSIRCEVYADHEEVCERVVVGTETVLAPDPAAVAALPKVEQTVEKVEWRCPPILGEREAVA